MPWLPMLKGEARLLSWLKRCLSLLLAWRAGRQCLKPLLRASALPGVLQADRGDTGGLRPSSAR